MMISGSAMTLSRADKVQNEHDSERQDEMRNYTFSTGFMQIINNPTNDPFPQIQRHPISDLPDGEEHDPSTKRPPE